MNIHLPAPRRRWPARLVNLAVVVVVLALAAATFVLSYTGVHVIALQAGVSTRLARVYPATFDALLVIACVAAVILRDARWWIRSYAWLVIILVVAVVGAADAVHAMNVALGHRTMEGVVAATPWVLVLLGFSLMLTILQHSRAQHAAAASQSGRLSRRAAKRAAEQPAGQPVAAIEQPADLAGRPSLAPALRVAALDATPVPDSTPAPDATVVDMAPAVDAAAPDQADDPAGTTVSWHEYWDLSHEPDSASRTYPAADDPEDQHHPSAPAEPSDQSYLAAPAETGDIPRQSETTQADSPVPQRQSAEGEADTDAPPFATAPFATVPRLNRVRSTPTPPEEDED
jgi:Protein of unknown function (DUF2637)